MPAPPKKEREKERERERERERENEKERDSGIAEAESQMLSSVSNICYVHLRQRQLCMHVEMRSLGPSGSLDLELGSLYNLRL